MSDPSAAQQEALDKAWKILDFQADTMLKLAQARTEVWKVVIGAMAAGGAVVAGLTALIRLGL